MTGCRRCRAVVGFVDDGHPAWVRSGSSRSRIARALTRSASARWIGGRRHSAAASARSCSARRPRTSTSSPASAGSSRSGTSPVARTTSTSGAATTRSRPARRRSARSRSRARRTPSPKPASGADLQDRRASSIAARRSSTSLTPMAGPVRRSPTPPPSWRRRAQEVDGPDDAHRREHDRRATRAPGVVRRPPAAGRDAEAGPGRSDHRRVADAREHRPLLPPDLGVRVPLAAEGQARGRRDRRATGEIRQGGSLHAAVSKMVTRDALFDIGADTIGLLVPGGASRSRSPERR